MKTRRLSQNYYSASNQNGSISTSRFGAENDREARAKARELLGGTLPAGVTLYRHGQGNPIQYEVVAIGS
jgi:hypothetical protein